MVRPSPCDCKLALLLWSQDIGLVYFCGEYNQAYDLWKNCSGLLNRKGVWYAHQPVQAALEALLSIGVRPALANVEYQVMLIQNKPQQELFKLLRKLKVCVNLGNRSWSLAGCTCIGRKWLQIYSHLKTAVYWRLCTYELQELNVYSMWALFQLWS